MQPAYFALAVPDAPGVDNLSALTSLEIEPLSFLSGRSEGPRDLL